MLDISISSSKVRGRPKGRRNSPFNVKHNPQIVYPTKMPYTPEYLRKIELWEANSMFGHDKEMRSENITLINRYA